MKSVYCNDCILDFYNLSDLDNDYLVVEKFLKTLKAKEWKATTWDLFKLIDALLDSDVIAHWIEAQRKYVNEDHIICRYQSRFLYDKYRIKIAPFELAKYFSKEMNPFFVDKTFGFHGTWIMPQYFDRETIEKIMTNYYANENKKIVWETFLQKVYSENYRSAFTYLETMCDTKGIHLWG
jgi:hypothetical protein